MGRSCLTLCVHVHTPVCACVQEYVRLISPWCQVNVGSCRFVLGQCYLANGEGQKVSLSVMKTRDLLGRPATSLPVSCPGPAVFPGSGLRGGERGLPDEAGGERG